MEWNELQSNGTNDTVISRQTGETGMQFTSQWVAFSNVMKHQNEYVLVSGCRREAAAQRWGCGDAGPIGEGVRGCSYLARHHRSGEQLVQLNQLVGRGVKLERNAV